MGTNESRQKESDKFWVFLAVGNLLAAVLAWIGYTQTGNRLTGVMAGVITAIAVFAGVRYAALRQPRQG